MYNHVCDPLMFCLKLKSDPLMFCLKLGLETQYPTRKVIHDLINNNSDDIRDSCIAICTSLSPSTSSKRITYKSVMNPDLEPVADVYATPHTIPEVHRKAFTRFRLSSHNLAIETGRWNRRGRGTLPREERLCPWREVQDEQHVITACPLSFDIRNKYNIRDTAELRDSENRKRNCKFLHEILTFYDSV